MLGGSWLTDLVLDVAPRLPFRDGPTLRAQHPGLSDDDLAQMLISGAAKSSATIGAAGGALAAVEFAAPPTLLTAPAQLAAETLLVATVEIKLLAELHEVYGVPAAGPLRGRAMAYVVAWSERRGIDPLSSSLLVVLPGRLGQARPAEPADPPGRAQPHDAGPADERRGRRQHGQPPRDPTAGGAGPRRPPQPRPAPSAARPSAADPGRPGVVDGRSELGRPPAGHEPVRRGVRRVAHRRPHAGRDPAADQVVGRRVRRRARAPRGPGPGRAPPPGRGTAPGCGPARPAGRRRPPGRAPRSGPGPPRAAPRARAWRADPAAGPRAA